MALGVVEPRKFTASSFATELAANEPLCSPYPHSVSSVCAGRQVERVGDRVTVDDAEQLTSRRCARVHGFSLHADVAIPARDRKRLERLSRYIARPPLANERLHQRSDGKLVYLFRKPWRDGTRGVVFTPAELIEKLIEKLIALIPPPQANLLRYHGVLAPGSRLRNLVVADRRDRAGVRPRAGTRCTGRKGMVPFTVPGVGKEETTSSTQGVSGVRVPTIFGPTEVGQRADPERLVEPKSVHAERAANLADDGSIAAVLSSELLSRESPTASGVRFGFQTPTGEQVRRRMSWAELMKRVFSVDVLQCPACQGKMKIIAEITQPKVIKRFLAALELLYEAPVITQARPPPQMDFGWNDEVEQGPAVNADTNTTSYWS